VSGTCPTILNSATQRLTVDFDEEEHFLNSFFIISVAHLDLSKKKNLKTRESQIICCTEFA
jgi:hypothetical protein